MNNSQEFKQLMSDLTCDVIEGSVPPQTVNAACNASGKLLKAVELEFKYGGARKGNGGRAHILLTA